MNQKSFSLIVILGVVIAAYPIFALPAELTKEEIERGVEHIEKVSEALMSAKQEANRILENINDEGKRKIICDSVNLASQRELIAKMKSRVRVLESVEKEMTPQQLERFKKVSPIILSFNSEKPFCEG